MLAVLLHTLLQILHELLFLVLLSLPILLLLSAERPPPLDLVYLAEATATTVRAWARPAPRRARLDRVRHAHIIDAIMRHSDPATLLVFRCTSRRLRLVANTLLAAHVTITDAGLSPPAPGLPYVPQYPALVPGWPSNLARTRVLDIQYGAAWHPLLRETAALLPRLPALSLVRIHNSVRDLDFSLARRERHLHPNPAVYTVHFHDLACDMRPLQRASIPYGAGDVFVNLRYSRVRPRAPQGTYDGGTGPSGHAVYLFLTLAGAATTPLPRLNRAGAPATHAWRALLPYLASQVVQHIVTGSSENTYLFVGDEEEGEGAGAGPHAAVPPGRRSVMARRDRLALSAMLDAELEILLADGYFAPQSAMNRVARQVGFATFEDVRDMLGPEMFDLVLAP
ncbi:unnamed protein product [Cutaneotrichosporon oleaginosum]